ncbi:hypothetical protein F5Y09DRAFT_341386 [Xylaria sp. FL1042]|nr:hypothetical protein F5Y09DRAFT_341386 [Xylaria sp. FL1042]
MKIPTDSDPPNYTPMNTDLQDYTENAAHQASHTGRTSPLVSISIASLESGKSSNPNSFHQQQSFFHGWLPELVALLLSAASLITIGVLLVVYHGRTVSSFPDGITLNAVVAVLTAAYKAALLYTVSSAIGQSKWNLFSTRAQRLRDFEHIDEASRGPQGALRALISIPLSITSLGAIITILSLLIDPFAQQLIDFGHSGVAIESNLVSTEIFTNFNITPTANDSYNQVYFNTYTNAAAWNEPTLYDRQAHCPTGNCTFEPFMALEWCARTEVINVNRVTSNCTLDDISDIFSEIHEYQQVTGNRTVKYQTCAFFLDGDKRPLTTIVQSFAVVSGAELLSSYNSNFTTDTQYVNVINSPDLALSADYGWGLTGDTTCGTWLGVSCPPAVLSYLLLDDTLIAPKKIVQSILTLCQTEFNVTVTSGRTTTTPTFSQYGRFIFDKNSWDDRSSQGPTSFCFAPTNNTREVPINNMSSAYAHIQKPQHLNSSLSFCWVASEDLKVRTGSMSDYWWGYWFLSLYYFLDDKKRVSAWAQSERGNFDSLSSDDYCNFINLLNYKGLSGIMESITAALNSAWSANSKERVTGSYLQNESIFHIQWQWILLPVTLNLLAFVLQIVVIQQSRSSGQRHLWRGSILAALYHGVGERTIESDMASIDDMRKDADATVVRLQFAKDGRAMLIP